MSEFKNCPFCGGGEVKGIYVNKVLKLISCPGCNSTVVFDGAEGDDVITAYNTRAGDAEEGEDDGVS